MKQIKLCKVESVEALLPWRMEVINDVFGEVSGADYEQLENANRFYYERHLADDSHVAFIAVVDSEEVGCGGVCFYEEMPSPDNPSGRCAYIMDVYVRGQYRRRGIGSAIVRQLVDEAHGRNITKICLESTPTAREVYTAVGFERFSDMMKYGGEREAILP